MGYIQKNNLFDRRKFDKFRFHQELLFRTSDFHSTLHELCHSRSVYVFKTNITPIKHAWLTDNSKNHSCFKESTNNGDGTPLPYWWILYTAQLLLSDCHLSENRFYAHSGMPWTVPFQQQYFLTNIISLSKFRTTFVLRCATIILKIGLK